MRRYYKSHISGRVKRYIVSVKTTEKEADEIMTNDTVDMYIRRIYMVIREEIVRNFNIM